jgi:hypothetical protein
VLTASIIRTVIIALMMEAVITSEMPVNFYKATWRSIPEDSHFHQTELNIDKVCENEWTISDSAF